MQEIRCPSCGKTFQVDEAGYAAIVQQVRDKEFTRELDRREAELTAAKESAVRLAVTEKAAEKDRELAELKQELLKTAEKCRTQLAEIESSSRQSLADKETEIARLNARIELEESKAGSAVKEAVLDRRDAHRRRIISRRGSH